MQERTVILYTFSKKFAMTGWRLGASIAPTDISNQIAKLNTNDESCTTHFVQYGGVEGVRGDQSAIPVMLNTLRDRRDVAVNMLNAMPGISVHSPEAAFYLFPDVTGAMENKGISDLAAFAEQALHATGVSFCTRRHFGRPQTNESRQYIRFAFSGINKDDIAEGLELFGNWVAKG
jgi:aspartate/methionine/tyrosine aminotransferase